jgi:hypothetical protein
MTTGEIIFSIINWVLYTIGIVAVIGMGPSFGFGVYFLIMRFKEKEETKKKSLLKKGIFILLLPWILIVGSLILVVILTAAKTLLMGGVE